MYKFILFCLLTVLSQQIIRAESSEKTALKIVALSPHAVEMLYAIGAGSRILATIEYADYPAAAQKIPRLGNFTGIQIEKIIALQPDLIIGWKSGNKLADLKKIESLGFNIFYSHPKDIPDISDEFIRLGEVTGLQKQAQIAADNLRQKYQGIKARYSDKKRVRVFYQLWHDPLRTLGPDNWSESLIDNCNGDNVFNDTDTPYPVISLEDVLNKDPEVIIIPHQSGSMDSSEKFWSKWQNISAVKHNRIFSIDADLLHRFGPRAIEGFELLCKAIDSARNEPGAKQK